MSETVSALGYRGYIGARPVFGQRTAQHVQNLVVRDYAQQQALKLKLSASEYTMPACYMILRQVLDELPQLDGIIFYSLFLLPMRSARRHNIYEEILSQGKSLHFALEAICLADTADVERVENIWLVQQALYRRSRNLSQGA